MSGRVEDRRVPVGVSVGLGDRPLGQPGNLVQNAAGSDLVHLSERLGTEKVLALQHLEEVELDVPEVALEVTHRSSPCHICHYALLASNLMVPNEAGGVIPRSPDQVKRHVRGMTRRGPADPDWPGASPDSS